MFNVLVSNKIVAMRKIKRIKYFRYPESSVQVVGWEIPPLEKLLGRHGCPFDEVCVVPFSKASPRARSSPLMNEQPTAVTVLDRTGRYRKECILSREYD